MKGFLIVLGFAVCWIVVFPTEIMKDIHTFKKLGLGIAVYTIYLLGILSLVLHLP